MATFLSQIEFDRLRAGKRHVSQRYVGLLIVDADNRPVKAISPVIGPCWLNGFKTLDEAADWLIEGLDIITCKPIDSPIVVVEPLTPAELAGAERSEPVNATEAADSATYAAINRKSRQEV